jgi:hypothetical protein
MQALLNIANAFAGIVLAWLGPCCYVAGASSVIGGAYLLYQSRLPGHPLRHRMWVPVAIMMIGFIFFGFPEFLNLGTATIGGSARASAGAALTSYTVPDGNSWLGLSPTDTLLAIIQSFILFFRAFGAMWVFQSLTGIKGVWQGTRRHGWFSSAVKGIGGFLVMNIDTVARQFLTTAQGAGAA